MAAREGEDQSTAAPREGAAAAGVNITATGEGVRGRVTGGNQHKQQVPVDSPTRERDSNKVVRGQEHKEEGDMKDSQEVAGDPPTR